MFDLGVGDSRSRSRSRVGRSRSRSRVGRSRSRVSRSLRLVCLPIELLPAHL